MIHTRLKFFVFLALLLLTAGTATASPMGGDYWEFNAYANAGAVRDILEALSGIVTSGGFKSIYLGLAMLGLAISAGTGLIGGNPKKLIGYFVGFMLLTYAVFGMKVTVLVKEMVYISGAGMSGHYSVGEVPGIIAVPFSTISYIGTGLTNLLETGMTKTKTNTPSLPEGVLPFGAKAAITKDMTELRITDPNISRNFKEWVSKCALPRLVSRQMSMDEMAHAPDLMEYFKKSVAGNSQVTFVQFYSSNPNPSGEPAKPYNDFGGIFSCAEGIKQLEVELKAHMGDSLSQIGKKLYPQYASDALLSAGMASSIAGDLLGKSAGMATNMAVQGALIDVVNGVGQYQAEVLGADATLLAMNINNAKRSQKTGWYTASVLFRDMSSYMYAAIQVFLIGITPLIIILMLVPGMGAKLGGSYMKAVVWLASWWPALHIVNFMMESYYTNSAETVYGIGDGAGLTMMNAGASAAFTDNMIIAIGFMATLVPTLMWGIINGTGMALTSMLDRASGAQYATSAAQDAAAGNFRAGNIGMNTYSANKYDSMQTRVTGRAAISENHAGTGLNQSTNQGGADISLHGKQVDKSISESQSIRLSEATKQVDTSKEALSNAVTSTATQSSKELSSIGENASIGKNGDVSFRSDEGMSGAIQHAASLLHSAKHMDADAKETFNAANASAGISISGGVGKDGKFKPPTIDFSVGGSASAGYKDSTTISASVSKDGAMVFKNDKGETVNLTSSEGSGSSMSSADVASSVRAYENSDSYAKIDSKVKAFEQAESHSKEVAEDVAREQKLTVAGGVNQQDIRGVRDGDKSKFDTSIRAVNPRAATEPVDNVNEHAKVASDALVLGVQSQTDALLGGAESKHTGEKDSRVAERLDELNQSNKALVQSEIIDKAKSPLLGAPLNLDKLLNYSIGGNKFAPAGMVMNKGGDSYDMVYRTHNNKGDHEYYAVGNKGALTKLNDLSYGERGQVFYSGAQINQLDNYNIDNSALQRIEPTKENVQAYHNSLTQNTFGNGVALDAASHVNLNEYEKLRNFDDEYQRDVGEIYNNNTAYASYMNKNMQTTREFKLPNK